MYYVQFLVILSFIYTPYFILRLVIKSKYNFKNTFRKIIHNLIFIVSLITVFIFYTPEDLLYEDYDTIYISGSIIKTKLIDGEFGPQFKTRDDKEIKGFVNLLKNYKVRRSIDASSVTYISDNTFEVRLRQSNETYCIYDSVSLLVEPTYIRKVHKESGLTYKVIDITEDQAKEIYDYLIDASNRIEDKESK